MLLNRPLAFSTLYVPPGSTVGAPVASVRASFNADTAKSSGASTLVFDKEIYDHGWTWAASSQFTVPVGVDLVVCTFEYTRSSFALLDDKIDILKNGAVAVSRQCDRSYWGNAYQRAFLPVVPGDVLSFRMTSSGGFTLSAATTSVSLVGYDLP